MLMCERLIISLELESISENLKVRKNSIDTRAIIWLQFLQTSLCKLNTKILRNFHTVCAVCLKNFSMHTKIRHFT